MNKLTTTEMVFEIQRLLDYQKPTVFPEINGFNFHETNEEYHASEGLSSSSLKFLRKSPHAFWMKKKYPKLFEKKSSGGQKLGTLEHLLFLESWRVPEVRVVEGNRATTKVKDQVSELEEKGFIVCKPQEWERSVITAYEILSNPKQELTRSYFALPNKFSEVSIRAEHEGLTFKCRPDLLYLNGDDSVIFDIKTFNSLKPRDIINQTKRMDYHLKTYFYLWVFNKATGFKTKRFVHIFIDIESFEARSVNLTDMDIEASRMIVEPLIKSYVDGMKTGEWPLGFEDKIYDLSLPPWAYEEETLE